MVTNMKCTKVSISKYATKEPKLSTKKTSVSLLQQMADKLGVDVGDLCVSVDSSDTLFRYEITDNNDEAIASFEIAGFSSYSDEMEVCSLAHLTLRKGLSSECKGILYRIMHRVHRDLGFKAVMCESPITTKVIYPWRSVATYGRTRLSIAKPIIKTSTGFDAYNGT